MFFRSSEPGNPPTNLTPKTFNVLRVCTRDIIYKILRVIYHLVHETLIRQTVICTPAVGHYGYAWPNTILNNPQKRGWIPRLHRHKKSMSSSTFKTAENPIQRPLLYFRWPFLALSISTTTPGPPKISNRWSSQKMQTSRQNELQSITLFLLIDNSWQRNIDEDEENQPNRTKSTNNFLRKFRTGKPWTRYQALCKVMSTFDLSSPPMQFFRYLPVAAELLLAPVNTATMATLLTETDVCNNVMLQEEISQLSVVGCYGSKIQQCEWTSTTRHYTV